MWLDRAPHDDPNSSAFRIAPGGAPPGRGTWSAVRGFVTDCGSTAPAAREAVATAEGAAWRRSAAYPSGSSAAESPFARISPLTTMVKLRLVCQR